MKQQSLRELRNYTKSPRSAHEGPDPDYRSDQAFTEEDYKQSPTKQSEADACDINSIMKRYEATGFMPDSEGRTPLQGDFTTMETYHEAQNIVATANSQFHSLPAQIRATFSNDPAKFLGYVEQADKDPEVAKTLISMGLANEVKPEPESEQQRFYRESNKRRNEPKAKSKEASAPSDKDE